MSNLEDHEAEQAAITAAHEHIEAHRLTYTVIVTRDVTESTVIQLTAPTEQRACDMALELSGRDGTEWRRDDVLRPASENYVTDVSVADPAPAPEFCGIIDRVMVGGIMFRAVRADLSGAKEVSPVLKGNHIIWDSRNGLAIAFVICKSSSGAPGILRAWPATHLPITVPKGEGVDAADAIHHILTMTIAARDTYVPADQRKGKGKVEAAPPMSLAWLQTSDAVTDHIIEELFYDPQTDAVEPDHARASDALGSFTVEGVKKCIHAAILEYLKSGNSLPAPQHVTADAAPELAVLSLPLGGTMILELGRCIEPAGLFRSAKVIRNYRDAGAAQAWCDGYARRHKQGGK